MQAPLGALLSAYLASNQPGLVPALVVERWPASATTAQVKNGAYVGMQLSGYNQDLFSEYHMHNHQPAIFDFMSLSP